MRTTLDIDDDVLSSAREIARYEKKTAGKVLSELARKALLPEAGDDRETSITIGLGGFPCLPASGRIITNEMVRQVQDDLDREEVEAAIALRHQRPAGPG